MRMIADTRARGFSLVELMVVVVIVMVLAVVAVGAYRRHMDNARKSEVYSMFGEIRVKEEAYHAEFSSYLSTAPLETTLYPTTPNGQPQTWGVPPATFVYLGINPGRAQVYCGYAVIARGTAIGARGASWFNNQVPTTDWWYAHAMCDNDSNAAVNAHFVTSSDNTAVYEETPHN